ncbi:MAG TPA: ATP-dependent helicase [Candidatus Krumholzibacteria bacterium]|nr:ATP-dependent helicase [Candidatus Krumholzibacteria bacterium]HPD73035.1 ATP-dependent helicase [Candidatus Krumholzibacteria bacterium]HRY41834.1 ATP-dependent helicase [Candidatus Krumholzibacteria bacterium]
MRSLVWTTTAPSRAQLRRDGYHVVRFRDLRRAIVRSRAAGIRRSSLRNPAAAVLARFARFPAVAVLDVPCETVEDLRLVHGYLVEPAYRRDCSLLVHATRELETLQADAFVDPEWGYPWTLERLRHLAKIAGVPRDAPLPPRDNWRRRLARRLWRRDDGAPGPRSRLDPEQTAAAHAGDGVVQVIAPAGSGKTTVLVERVKTLLERGVPADRILCTTFNKDAKLEIAARLAKAEVAGVAVRSFHGLGWSILHEERRLRSRIGAIGHAQWRQLAREAMDAEPGGVWIDAPDAQAAISAFKLAAMVDPPAARIRADPQDARARTAARLYELYERCLRQRHMLDFDDLIAAAVDLLRKDAAVRRRWQERFLRVLVDEYQDIEPAQAILVGLLAAPQDSLFCVGDEDQCIYAWRRATVERVVELDQVYPGLERYPLVRNYRCGTRITTASRRAIEHNRRRFRKPLLPGAAHAGEITVTAFADRGRGAAFVADRLRDAERGRTAVLARTTALLRDVALACARRGVGFDGPAKLVRSTEAGETVAAYLRLVSDPGRAAAEDVDRAFRIPNRALPASAAESVAASLRAGDTFARAVAPVTAPSWRRARIAEAAAFLDALVGDDAADRVIARLRGEGGLDRHYASAERLNPTEQVEVEALVRAQAAARGMSPRQFAAQLDGESRLLREHRRPAAVELVTIHGAKGREWSHVILFGADQGQLPHACSAAEGASGVEDERRLFYVAVTRAKDRLEIVCTARAESRFLAEAGLRVRAPAAGQAARGDAASTSASPNRGSPGYHRADTPT